MRYRRGLLVSLAVVAAYLITLSATVVARHDHVRPLYDAFVPPSSYRFVDPPAFFASGNVEPTPISERVALGHEGSEATGLATPDGQFVINLARGAVATTTGATAVLVRIAPVAPRRLAPVPAGLRPNGNAYRVEMTYQPRGGSVTRFAKPGTLLMEIPEVGQHLFASPDAKRWSSVPTSVIAPSGLTMTATFNGPGYYVAATSLPELAAPPGHRSRVAVVVGVVTAALAGAMFLGAFLFVRKRRRARWLGDDVDRAE